MIEPPKMTPEEYKNRRLKLGLTQKGLGLLLDVDYMTVQRRELDKQKITKEAELAIKALAFLSRKK